MYFSSNTNCFDLATQSGHALNDSIGLRGVNRPDYQPNLIGSTHEKWVQYCESNFSPKMHTVQKGSTADRNADVARWTGNYQEEVHKSRKVICFPYVDGAQDYHFVVKQEWKGKIYYVE